MLCSHQIAVPNVCVYYHEHVRGYCLEFGSAAQIQIVLLSHCDETLARTEVAVALQYHSWSMERWIKARLTSGPLPHPVFIGWLRASSLSLVQSK